MTKFIQEFKKLAHDKSLTSSHMLALCFYKTIKAKSENKTEILNYFIKKAFTPKGGQHWWGVQNAHRGLSWMISPRTTRAEDGTICRKRFILGLDFDEVLTISESEMFADLLARTTSYDGAVK